MNVKNLDDWYSTKEYDFENKEFNRILKLGKVGERKVLVIGSYGALAIAHKLVKYVTSLFFVLNTKKLIVISKKKKRKKFKFKNGK